MRLRRCACRFPEFRAVPVPFPRVGTRQVFKKCAGADVVIMRAEQVLQFHGRTKQSCVSPLASEIFPEELGPVSQFLERDTQFVPAFVAEPRELPATLARPLVKAAEHLARPGRRNRGRGLARKALMFRMQACVWAPARKARASPWHERRCASTISSSVPAFAGEPFSGLSRLMRAATTSHSRAGPVAANTRRACAASSAMRASPP